MSLEKIVYQMIENRLADLHTAIPGRIETYDKATQKASVKPLLKREYKDGQADEYPVITAVPVVFPGTSNGILHFDLIKGDGCLLIFSERSIDKWLSSGDVVSPNSRRKHDLSDAIAIPGLYSFNKAGRGESGVVLKNGTAKLKLRNNLVALGNDQNELVDLFEQLLTAIENMTILTSLGPQKAINLATFTAIKTAIGTIKGEL